MIRFITEHWELKLVALAIAIALWTYTNGQVRIDHTITVQLPDSAVMLPSNYRITNIQPQAREFTITVSMPESLRHSLGAGPIVPRLVVVASALRAGMQSFPVSNRILGLDDDIRILRSDSDAVQEIRVLFAPVVTDTLPVELPRLVGVPEGLEATVSIDPTRVRVSGTAEDLARFRFAGAAGGGTLGARMLVPEPITLSDSDSLLHHPSQVRVRLTLPGDRLTILDQVTATIIMRPVPASRALVDLPVRILASDELIRHASISIAPPLVTITVHGPENLLRTLDRESDLTVYVDLDRDEAAKAILSGTVVAPGHAAGAEPGSLGREHVVPLALLAPAGLTMDPVMVRLEVTPLPGAGPVPPRRPSAPVIAP